MRTIPRHIPNATLSSPLQTRRRAFWASQNQRDRRERLADAPIVEPLGEQGEQILGENDEQILFQ